MVWKLKGKQAYWIAIKLVGTTTAAPEQELPSWKERHEPSLTELDRVATRSGSHETHPKEMVRIIFWPFSVDDCT